MTKPQPTLTIICDAVAAAYELSLNELFSGGMDYCVQPRKVAAHLCVAIGKASVRTVSQFMNTSVENINRWCGQIQEAAAHDADLCAIIMTIRETLQQLNAASCLREPRDIDVSDVMQRALMANTRGPMSISTDEVRVLASHTERLELALSLAGEAFRDSSTNSQSLAREQLRAQLITLGFLKDDSHDASH